MATSGSNNFSQTRDQLIFNAYQLLGLYGVGQTMSAEDVAFAKDMLNMILKSWSTQGLHLWCKSEGVLYLDQYQNKYTIGNASSDAYATTVSDEIITKITADVTVPTSSLTVSSTTGMAISDKIGIVLDSKDIFWTTIATIPSSTTLTLTDALSSAVSVNNLIYTFTNRLYKPLRILSARSVMGLDEGSTSSKTELVMNSMAYQTYFDLPSKTSDVSRPTSFSYSPKLTDGTLYVWPRPNDCSCRIEFSYERIIEDLDAASDDIDIPSEWLLALSYTLATLVGPAFGKDQKIVQTLGPMASSFLDALKDWDSEITSVDCIPDLGDY